LRSEQDGAGPPSAPPSDPGKVRAGPSSTSPSDHHPKLEPEDHIDEEALDDPALEDKRSYSTPAQDKSRENLNVLKARLASLLAARGTALAADDCEKQIKIVSKTF